MINAAANLIFISALWIIKVSCETTEFTSAPTTVKAPENNTVLLPCYLNTVSTGNLFIYLFICLFVYFFSVIYSKFQYLC